MLVHRVIPFPLVSFVLANGTLLIASSRGRHAGTIDHQRSARLQTHAHAARRGRSCIRTCRQHHTLAVGESKRNVMTEPAIDTFDNLKFNYFRRVFANGRSSIRSGRIATRASDGGDAPAKLAFIRWPAIVAMARPPETATLSGFRSVSIPTKRATNALTGASKSAPARRSALCGPCA